MSSVQTEEKEKLTRFKVLCDMASEMFDDLAERIRKGTFAHDDGSVLSDEDKAALNRFGLKLEYLSKRLKEMKKLHNDPNELNKEEVLIMREVGRVLDRVNRRQDGALEICLANT